MKELSLHILDIANNSTVADATLVEITIDENLSSNILTITIVDNGKGMSEELLAKVRDPFTTSRTTRRVGLGIPLLENAASVCGGGLDISSRIGVGTTVKAWFKHDCIDRQPLGDMASTITTLIRGNPEVNFVYTHTLNNECFEMDTRQIKDILQGAPIDTFEVVTWISEYIIEGLNTLRG